jgi:RimJ/RimL family protein N-acetyltransferase
MMICGEKVQLRHITPQDFPHLIAWSGDAVVNRYLEGDYPLSLEECPVWLQSANSSRHTQRYAIVTRHNGELIGDIELDHITWRSGDAELRIRIGEKSRWDQGYGTDAVTALLSHAFINMHLSRVYLRVYSANHRAIRCYEKAGFKKEGRISRLAENGQIREVYLMRVLKKDYMRVRNQKPAKYSA